jgi:type VI secretion system secreted protein VgrG
MALAGGWERRLWMTNGNKRQCEIKISLGGAQIALIQLKASEAFSQPFHISVDMLSSLDEIDLMPHLGKPAVISISEDDVLLRHFHGILTDGEFLEHIDKAGWVYRLTLRPTAHLHEQGRYFRIFQTMSTRDIVAKVFKDCGIQACFDKLSGGKRVRKYCVQYGESDFSFVSRLLEEEGIYYFYEHTKDNHTLVLCDSPTSHSEAKASPLTFNPSSSTIRNVDSNARFDAADLAYIQEWRERVEAGGEKEVILRDFDFQEPNAPLEEIASIETSLTGRVKDPPPCDVIKVYDYPGRYYVKKEGEELAKSLLAARRANRRSFSGSSKNASLACGTTFTLKYPKNDRFDEKKYLLTRCQHTIGSEIYRSGMGGGGGHMVVFEAVPAETLWQSLRKTPRPVVWGPETAIVTGPKQTGTEKEEEIWCDEYGRVKVKFHWDRDGEVDDNSSCWIRVSQTGGLGNIILPRVGHEVLVDFINGDPDRPVIVGRVFNKANAPYYGLGRETNAAEKTRATWRSKSYKEVEPSGAAKPLGGSEPGPGANELRFDDKTGAEEVFIHAQRYLNTRVRLDESHYVGNDQDIDIGQHRTMQIDANDTVTIGGNRETKITGNRQTNIDGTDALHVKEKILIKSDVEIEFKVGDSTIVMTPGAISISSDNIYTKASLKNLNEGGMGAQISSGGNFVNTSPAGVTITGTMTLINSGGAKIGGEGKAGSNMASWSNEAEGGGKAYGVGKSYEGGQGSGGSKGSSGGQGYYVNKDSGGGQGQYVNKGSGGGQGSGGSKDSGGGQGYGGGKDSGGNKS